MLAGCDGSGALTGLVLWTNERGDPIVVNADDRSGWAQVWNTRTAHRADWNGCEACFPDRAGYEAFVSVMVAFVQSALRIDASDTVLDLGCGTGIAAVAVAERAGRVLALDYSEVALGVAREKRSRPNLHYEFADLNVVDLERFRPADKAYAIGSMFYLDSLENVFRIVDSLVAAGTEVLLVDLPDAELTDPRARDYDTSKYRHLAFRESDFTERYGNRLTFHRALYPSYVNDACRFSVHVLPS